MGLLRVIMNKGDFLDIASCLIASAVVVFLVMPVHEYAHGYVAGKLGDPTPRWQGRISLNPMNHIDYTGALMIFLIGFGWAKPVQVDARYFKNAKKGMAIVAFAGPLSNLIVAFIAALLSCSLQFIFIKTEIIYDFAYFVAYDKNPESFWHLALFILYMVLVIIMQINISLAVFNLIPIPPLDGSKILGAFLPDRIYWNIMRYERYLYFGLIFLLFFGSGFKNFLGNAIYNISDSMLDVAWLPFKFFV